MNYAVSLGDPLNDVDLTDALLVFDPYDITSLFTTSLGTTQVAADGDPVGFMGDCRAAKLAGQTFAAWMAANGHTPATAPGFHAKQATTTKRPLYKVEGNLRFLLPDTVDDCLVTAAIDLTGTDAVTVCVGLRKLSDAVQGIVAEISDAVSANNGSFRMAAPASATASYLWNSKGTGSSQPIYTNAAVAAPHSGVITGIADISTDSCLLRVNGVQVATAATDQGTGNFGNYALNLLSRANGGSGPANIRFYGFLLASSVVSAGVLADFEHWLTMRTI